jgi:ketosteroid isomerase-like protein
MKFGSTIKELTMTTKELSERLVAMCKANQWREAIVELYADDVESAEAHESPTGDKPRVTKGKQAVLAKTDWWFANTETHGVQIKGPYPHGDDAFAVIFDMDITMKSMGQRMKMEEVAVYEAKNGKVVRERFFYGM